MSKGSCKAPESAEGASLRMAGLNCYNIGTFKKLMYKGEKLCIWMITNVGWKLIWMMLR